MSVLLEVTDLYKEYPLHGGVLGGRRTVHAVNGISFAVHSGDSLGLAGESGCGKTTTARLVLKLLQPTRGVVRFAGRDIAELVGGELLAFRRHAQLVFQNPYEALNPRFTVLRALLEPLIIHGIGATAAQRVERVTVALHRVHLNPPELFFLKYPHQLSGGQLQRVVIARALLSDPALLVADEPVSMLDVSIRAGVLNLMRELGQERSLTSVFISHDLALLRYMCTRTAVMYLGTICEIGPTAELIEHPRHPYTQALVSAVPEPDPDAPRRSVRVADSVPTPFQLPLGCPFADRCPEVMDICRRVRPLLQKVGSVHVACHLYPGEAGQPRQDAPSAPEAH
jgi:oligopeptide/dipeptide ABC transporter ATP-binding protein